MVYLDRFLIGSLISISAVAYYTTPSEDYQAMVVPADSLVSCSPRFGSAGRCHQDRATSLYERGVGSTFAILFPLILSSSSLPQRGFRFGSVRSSPDAAP